MTTPYCILQRWRGYNESSLFLFISTFHVTSSNGNIFRVTGPSWGKPPVTDGYPSQRPVTRSFGVHKSHHAPVPHPTMQHFVTEMCTHVHISNRNVHTCAYFSYKTMHYEIFLWCIGEFVRWVYFILCFRMTLLALGPPHNWYIHGEATLTIMGI